MIRIFYYCDIISPESIDVELVFFETI